jgi:hypothetical protein
VIKTIEEELKVKKLVRIKDALDSNTTNVVPVELLQEQIQLLQFKIDELVKVVNTIKSALTGE